MDDNIFQSCVQIGLNNFRRNLHLFHSQNSHISSDPSNIHSLKILEWLCFQICPKILLWSAKPVRLQWRKSERSLASFLRSSTSSSSHDFVCLCVQGRNSLRINACWQRKAGFSGGPMWPTFIKMMKKMRADFKKGSGIFQDV